MVGKGFVFMMEGCFETRLNEAHKECIVVYIMVAYPGGCRSYPGSTKAKGIKKSLEPAWAPPSGCCVLRIYGSKLSLFRTARGVSLRFWQPVSSEPALPTAQSHQGAHCICLSSGFGVLGFHGCAFGLLALLILCHHALQVVVVGVALAFEAA